MKSYNKMTKHDVYADWQINKSCNFNCPYCSNEKSPQNNTCFIGKTNIDKIVDGFNGQGVTFIVHMCGGEPFMHPDFVELCRRLTEKHYISINTNLSTKNVYEFCEKIDPKRVDFINCAIHIVERERLGILDEFIKKFKMLENAGFNVYTTQVIWPPILKRYDELFDYFKKKGIIIRPRQTFWGWYNSNYYPSSYAPKEKQKILHFVKRVQEIDKKSGFGNNHLSIDLDAKAINGFYSFKGLPCSAGKEFIRIEYDGKVKRCPTEKMVLGNIFEEKIKFLDKPAICNSKICNNCYYGFVLAKGKSELITKQTLFYSRILHKHIYPFTTPKLKLLKKLTKKIFKK